jgi:hypothetical protein
VLAETVQNLELDVQCVGYSRRRYWRCLLWFSNVQTGQGRRCRFNAMGEKLWGLCKDQHPVVKTEVEQFFTESSKIALASPSICLLARHGQLFIHLTCSGIRREVRKDWKEVCNSRRRLCVDQNRIPDDDAKILEAWGIRGDWLI